jgi:OFA family oxalate/formate antiporter-like MFS transporter
LVAGGMVGIASLGNGVGRVFWAWVSDLITRRATFAVMFILQVLLFWFLPRITSSSTMTIVAFVILMCYGGGFGTMPAFTADYFGPKNVGPIYGLMLTAWSFASVFGPLYIARMRETAGNYAGALHVIAILMLVSIVLPIIVRPPRREQSV